MTDETQELREIIPADYWPDDSRRRAVSNDDLTQIIERIAGTNEPITSILASMDVSDTTFYRLRAQIPKLSQALAMAQDIRRERLEDETLSIADEDLPDDDKQAALDLQHRRLRIQARQHITTRSRTSEQAHKLSRITIDVPEEAKGSQAVQINIVNYGQDPEHKPQASDNGRTLEHGTDRAETPGRDDGK